MHTDSYLHHLPTQHDAKPNVFSYRADALVAAVMPLLAWLKDNEGWTLTRSRVSEAFSFNGLIGLACISRLPPAEKELLDTYLECLPDFRGQIKPFGHPQFWFAVGDKTRIASLVDADVWNRALESAEHQALSDKDLAAAGARFREETKWVVWPSSVRYHELASMYVTGSELHLIYAGLLSE